MTPDSGWPLTKKQVEFLRRIRGDKDYCISSYTVVCRPDYKSYRKCGRSYPGKMIEELERRGMLLRDTQLELIINFSSSTKLWLFQLTYRAGEVLKEWDKQGDKDGKTTNRG